MNCHNLEHTDPSLPAAERDARRQVARLRGFYRHLLVFGMVAAGLLVINLATAPQHLWLVWPLAGWAIGLVFHGLATFMRGRWLGAEWEERKVRELIAQQSVK